MHTSNMTLRKLKITMDGTPNGTHITDTETNKEMPMVFELKISQKVNELPTIQISQYGPQVEVEGQGTVLQICRTCRNKNEILDVLRSLVDCQNGYPLPSYEKDWNSAMQRAKIILLRNDTKTPT